jgi:hypothetical protein
MQAEKDYQVQRRAHGRLGNFRGPGRAGPGRCAGGSACEEGEGKLQSARREDAQIRYVDRFVRLDASLEDAQVRWEEARHAWSLCRTDATHAESRVSVQGREMIGSKERKREGDDCSKERDDWFKREIG